MPYFLGASIVLLHLRQCHRDLRSIADLGCHRRHVANVVVITIAVVVIMWTTPFICGIPLSIKGSALGPNGWAVANSFAAQVGTDFATCNAIHSIPFDVLFN